MENLDLEYYTEKHTYETLKKLVDDQWGKMSEEEKCWRCGYISGIVEPTFHEYVLYSTKPGDLIELNEYTRTFKIIK